MAWRRNADRNVYYFRISSFVQKIEFLSSPNLSKHRGLLLFFFWWIYNAWCNLKTHDRYFLMYSSLDTEKVKKYLVIVQLYSSILGFT